MPRFRSKPPEIEAIQWTGSNFTEIETFVGEWGVELEVINSRPVLKLPTMSGIQLVQTGSWVFKNAFAEFNTQTDELIRATHENLDGTEI